MRPITNIREAPPAGGYVGVLPPALCLLFISTRVSSPRLNGFLVV